MKFYRFKKIYFIACLFFAAHFYGINVVKAVSNCECSVGSTGTFVWHSTDHTSDASSESQCNNDCSISVIPPSGKVVYYSFNGSKWKQASGSCQNQFGGDYSCIASGNIKNSSQCKGTCAGGQCCLSTAVNFVGGSNPEQCSANYMCKNILTLPESERARCTNGCTAPDIANGSCCPTFPSPSASIPNLTGEGKITSTKIPGSSVNASSGLVQCGRPGQDMCTLCDLFKGMNYIIHYIMRISIAVGLAAFTIAGVMYVLSAGDSKQIGNAKGLMKNATIGFVVIFAGWIIINTAITLIGTRNGMGINVTSWGQFDCNSKAAQHVQIQ